METIAERLKQIRLMNGVEKKSDFAEMLGVKRTTYGSYERGVSFPPVEVLRKICDRFNVDMEWLLTGKGIASAAGRDVHVFSHNHIDVGGVSLGEPTRDPSIDMMRLLTKILSSGDQAIIAMTMDQLIAISRTLDAKAPAPRAPSSIAPPREQAP